MTHRGSLFLVLFLVRVGQAGDDYSSSGDTTTPGSPPLSEAAEVDEASGPASALAPLPHKGQCQDDSVLGRLRYMHSFLPLRRRGSSESGFYR